MLRGNNLSVFRVEGVWSKLTLEFLRWRCGWITERIERNVSFYLEVGCIIFFRNHDINTKHCTASRPRRLKSETLFFYSPDCVSVLLPVVNCVCVTASSKLCECVTASSKLCECVTASSKFLHVFSQRTSICLPISSPKISGRIYDNICLFGLGL